MKSSANASALARNVLPDAPANRASTVSPSAFVTSPVQPFLHWWRRRRERRDRARAQSNAKAAARARRPLPPWRRRLRRVTRPLGAALYALLALAFVTSVYGAWRAPLVDVPVVHDPRPVIVDVTHLVPIAVAGVATPRTTEEVARLVRAASGSVSIGGGRYSMGGQTATPGGLQLDLRQLTGVLALDTAARTVTVRAGTTWRQLQEAIDPVGLAVKVMQTYNTFTVGGALSVNAHGRYVGQGPLAGTVRGVRLVLADGSVVDASPQQRPELFWAAIGGYGGVGVVTEVSLDIARNEPVRREDTTMALRDYPAYFRRAVHGRADVLFHNADIYPDAYERVHAVSYRTTRAPLTEPAHLRPADQHSRTHEAAYALVTGWSRGAWVREHVLDPALFRGNPVTWRNYEASYDVSELEPASRERSTYVLQEYFVPVDSLRTFMDRARRVLQRHDVNAVNISIRHALPDSGTLLAWGPTESFAFVLYYRQDTDPAARREVGAWTRELVDAALASGGRWYLPYQPHATRAQFAAGYRRSPEFFAVRNQVDPAGKFTNTLWDLYAPAPNGTAPAPVTPARLPAFLPAEARVALDSVRGYDRAEGAAFLTHPEWDLVYTSDAYTRWLAAGRRPSGFPYAQSVGTFWRAYLGAWRHARTRYRVDAGTHVMLAVIGTSTAAEYGLKGLYENTIGRFAELFMPPGGTAEDRYAARVAGEYGALIHRVGWYEYPFGQALAGLWRDVPLTGPGFVRKWERRFALSAEYGVKAVYARLIGLGTAAGYAPDEETRYLLAAGWDDALAAADPALARVRHVATLDRGYALLAVPRYDAYRDALLALSAHADRVRLAEASGCDRITLVGTAPRGWTAPAETQPVVGYADPTSTAGPGGARTRVLLQVGVRDLLDVLAVLRREGRFTVEHVYDY